MNSDRHNSEKPHRGHRLDPPGDYDDVDDDNDDDDPNNVLASPFPQDVIPGAYREGGDLFDNDTTTVWTMQEEERVPPEDHDDEHAAAALVSAELVQQVPMVTAAPLSESCWSRPRNRCFVIGIVTFLLASIICCALVVSLLLLLGSGGDSSAAQDSSTSRPPDSPTSHPTKLPGIWNELGQAFVGADAGDLFGWFVSLSADGSVVAIGAISNDLKNGVSNSGRVQVYRLLDDDEGTLTWNKLGQDLRGEAKNDHFGRSISLSADGSIVAVGADYSSYHNEANVGKVQVYRLDGGNLTWNKLGQDLLGGAGGDWFGRSVSLSSDGSVVADGARFNGIINAGKVRVYHFDTELLTWKQLGRDLVGEEENEYFGTSVSLSGEGTFVAIGSYRSDFNGTDYGKVQVFHFDGKSWRWSKLGQSLQGDEEGDYFGAFIALSADGSVLAVSAYRSDSNEYAPGKVQVFQFDGMTWKKLGRVLVGKTSYDYFGYSVSLSADGSVLAIGARQSGHPDPKPPGYVQIFQLVENEWAQVGDDLTGNEDGDVFGRSVSLSADGTNLAVGAPQEGAKPGYAQVFRLQQQER